MGAGVEIPIIEMRTWASTHKFREPHFLSKTPITFVDFVFLAVLQEALCVPRVKHNDERAAQMTHSGTTGLVVGPGSELCDGTYSIGSHR